MKISKVHVFAIVLKNKYFVILSSQKWFHVAVLLKKKSIFVVMLMQMHAMHVAVNTNCYMTKLHNIMMKASDGNIFRVTGPFCGEFTGEFPAQRLVTRSFDVFFDLLLNKQFSKQSWGWWVETLSQSLWRHSNGEGAICAPIRNKISYLLCIFSTEGLTLMKLLIIAHGILKALKGPCKSYKNIISI